jgi:ABC-2 type transport system ATP-binding protein
MEAAFQASVREAAAAGQTVLLSSHILSEVEALCDHITIIRGGRVVEAGSLAQLRHLTRTSLTAELAGAPHGLADLPGVRDLHVEGTTMRCEVDTDRLDPVLARLAAIGTRGLIAAPPTLEELFLRRYETDQHPAPTHSGHEQALR